jgi:hypothetical protein
LVAASSRFEELEVLENQAKGGVGSLDDVVIGAKEE